MNRFIRYWNQNKNKIIITILIVVFIIILIQTINYILGQIQNEPQPSNSDIEDTSRPSESVMTGERLPEETTDNNIEIISQFVEFCNNREYENAYNLLSQDCKEELFATLDIFITDYCNNIFTTNITYNLELWDYTDNTYTYRIVYFENNILATGNVNSSNNIEDYITIIVTDEEKLNIKNFIEKENINKSQTTDGQEITITVNDRYIYNNYEKYEITIRNNTDKTILISDGINSNDICLVDVNEAEYNSMMNEVPLTSMEVAPKEEKTIYIRFYKMYNLYREIDEISFKNIILDKESYEQNADDVQKIDMSIDI